MSHLRAYFTYGFAIFAMFFGSGNLVFPIDIGNFAGNGWSWAFAGLFLTGIGLPLAGLFVVKRYQGSYLCFFEQAGGFAGVLLPILLLALLGPFGVVPRCITVAYGSLAYVYNGLSLPWYSFFFCFCCYLFCLNDSRMMKILGGVLSPFLMATLILLISMAIFKAPPALAEQKAAKAFGYGFTTGYQTMDLFAAYFFSGLVFNQIKQDHAGLSDSALLRFAIIPSLIGAGLLGLVYLGFVYLGAHYQTMLSGVKPEQMLPLIAESGLNQWATLVMALAMGFSCLTTAMALSNLFARYVTQRFAKANLALYRGILLATVTVAFGFSLLDFQGIARWLGPILQATYPGLIFLTLISLFWVKPTVWKIGGFWVLTALMSLKLLSGLYA